VGGFYTQEIHQGFDLLTLDGWRGILPASIPSAPRGAGNMGWTLPPRTRKTRDKVTPIVKTTDRQS